MTSEQLTWFLKGWIAGRGAEAAQPPGTGDWQELVKVILMADAPARRAGCGCGGARHG